ncbi:50S ribosomal protein L23, partial [Patescibacteria group bacterium]
VAAEKKEVKEETTLRPKGDLDIKPSKDVKVKRSKKEDTKNAYKVLLKPLITEKATDLVEQNKYSFAVALQTNKIEVKKAIKALYGVEPISVNIIRMRGKRVGYGRISGKRKNWKKAIITLKAGDKIEVYEGV